MWPELRVGVRQDTWPRRHFEVFFRCCILPSSRRHLAKAFVRTRVLHQAEVGSILPSEENALRAYGAVEKTCRSKAMGRCVQRVVHFARLRRVGCWADAAVLVRRALLGIWRGIERSELRCRSCRQCLLRGLANCSQHPAT